MTQSKMDRLAASQEEFGAKLLQAPASESTLDYEDEADDFEEFDGNIRFDVVKNKRGQGKNMRVNAVNLLDKATLSNLSISLGVTSLHAKNVPYSAAQRAADSASCDLLQAMFDEFVDDLHDRLLDKINLNK